MRIALIASSFLPRTGGVEEHVANVALQLKGLGHQVVIWATDQGDAVPSEFDGIPLRYLPCPLPARASGPAIRFLVESPQAWKAWRSAWRQDRPEVFHVHCFGPNGLYATVFARVWGTPLMLSHHGETFADANDVFEHSVLLRRGLRVGLKHAAAVTSCSQFAADDLIRFGLAPEAVDVVFNGVNLQEPSGPTVPGLPARYVLGVGRLVGTKNFDILIRAFAAIAKNPAAADVGLVIGGDGPEATSLAELAAELGIDDRVQLTGRLNRSQVGAVMADAELLVLPSAVEAFGITVLEGWRAGIPVVVTRRGGPPEFVDDGVTGVLIDPDDVQSIGESILELLKDKGRRADMGKAGAVAVQSFTWERAALRYQELYEAIV